MRYLLLLSLFIFGCTSQGEQPVVFRDLDKDFPTAETLRGEEMAGSYELYAPRAILVKDSLLFVHEYSAPNNFGRCFNMNTGEVIAPLVAKGRANNEMVDIDCYLFLGDSLQAISGNPPRRLNLYSIQDILEGNQYNPRQIEMSDTLKSHSFGLIDSNTIFGTLTKTKNSNYSKYFIFDGEKQQEIGKLSKDLVESNLELTISDLQFGGVLFEKQGGKLATVSDCAIQFEIIDLNNLTIEKSCYYNKVKIEKVQNENMRYSVSSSDYYVMKIDCNEDAIYTLCAKMTNIKEPIFFILKLDWNLNPIKKYIFEGAPIITGTFSENCDYFYSFRDNNSGEYQILMRYKL